MALYPVQIQADNENARDSFNVTMAHVFDVRSETMVFEALCKQYRHVVSWSVDGEELREYDNR